MERIKIKGMSVINLNETPILILSASLPVEQWKCDTKMGIDAKCSGNRGQELRISRDDIKVATY